MKRSFLKVLSIHLLIVNSIDAQHCDDVELQHQKCSLYLAPSTIPGAGLGVFSGIEMREGDPFDTAFQAIPLVDMQKHNFFRSVTSLLEHYVWELDAMGMEHEAPQGAAFASGLYAATNCLPGLVNIDGQKPERMVSPEQNPNDGAITEYFGSQVWATRYIPAGGELFLEYGDEWFKSRNMVDVPLSDDLEKAKQIMINFGNLNLNGNLQIDLWNLIRSVPFVSLVISSLPNNFELVRLVIENNDIGALFQPNATRSLDELNQYGTCLDMIQPQPSTIQVAGRGAFTASAFHKGERIITSPVIHIPDHSILNMFKKNWSVYGNWKITEQVESKQLLINYCFGHRESTVLLCPYVSGVNFINHNQSLANVRIRWTDHGRMSHNETLLDLPQENLPLHKSALAIDYIALRDIAHGEELFVDGGDAWEEAWQIHMELWEPQSEEDSPASAWNERLRSLPIRTQKEQKSRPYPSHLELRCHDVLTIDYYNWKEIINERGDTLWDSSDQGSRCNIVRRYRDPSGNWVYDVNFFDDEDDDDIQNEGVPGNAFSFVDKYYSSKLHGANVFRYPMQIPDDMLPPKWKRNASVELE